MRRTFWAHMPLKPGDAERLRRETEAALGRVERGSSSRIASEVLAASVTVGRVRAAVILAVIGAMIAAWCWTR